MVRVAEFEKVSVEQFTIDIVDKCGEQLKSMGVIATDCYKNVAIPERGTKGSACYDFVSPVSFKLEHGESIIIPTGIRAKIEEGWVLNAYPRSGLGFKTHVRLANTVGIIDSDYYNADNEGHIMIKLVADKPIEVKAGDRFAQGMFTMFGITYSDNADKERTNGFGSTGK